MFREVDIDGGAAEASRQLATSGGLIIRKPHQESAFAGFVRQLGKLLMITPVKILKTNNAPTLFSFRKMQPHTDPPIADYVGWYCSRAGLAGEKTIVVDSRSVLYSFNLETIETLMQVQCRVPNRQNVPTKYHLTYEDHTVVERFDNNLLLNYSPYLEFILDTKAKTLAFEKLATSLRNAEKEADQFELLAGQSLLINNRRFLHCRTDLSLDSPRCHYRYLVQKAS